MKTVFIIGNSRSGTTLLAQILGRNAAVFSFNEIHFFEQLWEPKDLDKPISKEEAKKLFSRLLAIQREGFLEYKNVKKYTHEIDELFKKIDRECDTVTKELIFKIFLEYETTQHRKIIACEQTPRNLFYINEIERIFPEVKFVNMVRDPRAVLLSQKNKWKLRKHGLVGIPRRESIRAWMNYHPFVMARLWLSGIRAVKESDLTDEKVLNIRFEDLTNNSEATVRRICQHVGIEFEYEMLDVPYWGSSRESVKPGTTGIKSDAANSWRLGGLSDAETAICENIVFPTAEAYGYERYIKRSNLIYLVIWYFVLPFKLFVSFILNVHRMSNIFDTLKRRLGA